MDTVTVKCPCGHMMGEFAAQDDHGGVLMKCPACKGMVRIDNQPLCHPEEYGDGKTVVASLEPQ